LPRHDPDRLWGSPATDFSTRPRSAVRPSVRVRCRAVHRRSPAGGV